MYTHTWYNPTHGIVYSITFGLIHSTAIYSTVLQSSITSRSQSSTFLFIPLHTLGGTTLYLY